MKKLMVIAAAVAMVGGAFAAGYDFKASVKTTKGKYGAQKTSYTVKLGLDDNGTYWWDDQGFADEKEAKAYVKSLTNDEKADYAWNDLGFDGVDSAYPVQEDYRGRKVWCYTFKFTEKAEDCYRVAGSAKLNGIVTIDELCGTWEFVEYDFGNTILADDADGVSEIAYAFAYRFNGMTLPKANKVEVTGTMGDVAYDGATIGTFAFAGQGAYDVKNDYIKNISGYLVGVLENPDCESCCDYDSDAMVFDCGDPIWDAAGTAAWGSFSLKYNKKY